MNVANARAVIGGNAPPASEVLDERSRTLQARGSQWVTTVQQIETQAQADEAALLIEELFKLEKEIDAARKAEADPVHKEWKAINARWKRLAERASDTGAAVNRLLQPYLSEMRRRQQQQAEEARRKAEEAAREAEQTAEAAYEAYADAQERGAAGPEANVLAALEDAKAAQAAAQQADRDAEAAANARAAAGGLPDEDGNRRKVRLQTTKKVVMDVPANFPPKVQAVALSKMVPWIVDQLGVNGLDALKNEIGRLVNLAHSKTGEVAPGCKVVEIERIVR
jgi:hypothetical protein